MLRERRKPKWTLDDPLIQKHLNDGSRTMNWESENGKITKIEDLDYNHLKNIINKFKRNQSKWAIYDSVKKRLETELIYRDLLKIEENTDEKTRRQLREQTTTAGSYYTLSF